MAASAGRRPISSTASAKPSVRVGQPRFQLYGRRKAKPLRPRQRQLIDSLLPRLRIDIEDARAINPPAFFDVPPRDIWLEIGFGGGEHLASLAARHPDIGFIGAEPFLNGIAKLLVAIDEQRLTNIRIFAGDARRLLQSITAASLGRIFILYPDPWPKRRHEKRRLLSPETISDLYRVMKSGAELRLASDSPAYMTWSLRNILRHGGFEWLASSARDWQLPPLDWIETRYEAKALRQGRKPVYLRFARNRA
jgi:tRNA (guanine-N7-)-methyltransferase